METYSGAWVGWIRIIPNQIFDTNLSNIILYDILSMQLGLSLFDADEEYRIYSQINDIFDHHYLNYKGKITLYNFIQ